MKNITSLFGKKETNDYDKYYRDDDDIYDDAEEGDDDVTTYGEKRTDGVSFNASSAPGAIHVLGGDMKSVTKTTLVFAPRNVGVADFENVEESADVEENDGEELDA